MKYRVIYASAVLASLVITAAAVYANYHRTQEWVHQHKESLPAVACKLDGDTFTTHLPLVEIETGGQPIPGIAKDGSYIEAKLTVREQEGACHQLEDEPDLTTLSEVHYRGNSSLHFDKKSYKLSFINNAGEESRLPVMGMPAHNEWILNGPFLDKTLLRNYMCMNVAGEIMGYAPRVRFCELFVDGSYQGVYVMMETVSRGRDRVDISAYHENDVLSSYILRVDRGSNAIDEIDNFTAYTRKLNPDTERSHFALDIEYPSKKMLTPELVDYITSDFSRFEKSLYSFDYDDPAYGYAAFVDVDSFVDYFIINEFFQNYDAMQFSTYFYKDVRGKIHLGPVWDYNNSCDNYMEIDYDGTGFKLPDVTWYYMMTKDEDFINQVIRRYRELRQGVLSEKYLLDYIEESAAYLGPAVERNYKVWGYSFDAAALDDWNRLHPPERNLTDYGAAIEQLKNFIITRGNWMDENIDILKQYCHESKVKKFNH